VNSEAGRPTWSGAADAATGTDLEALTHRPGPGPHWTSIRVEGQDVVTLADLPPLRDRLLFVGLSPSDESVAAGHYHQDPAGLRFWAQLLAARILPAGTQLDSADDALVARGHGITDLLKQPSPERRSERELTAGVGPLWQKVAIWRPAAVVFIDTRAAAASAGRPLDAGWGRLAGVALAGRPCLLMPAADGADSETEAAIAFFRDLAGIIEGLLPSDPGT
jgi:G:T/U-mismatch repair DNA glycosylase